MVRFLFNWKIICTQYSTAHNILANKLNILHHDISINNVLLCRNQEGEMARGLLIDFDYAETMEDPSEEDPPQASSPVTLPSQATNVEDLVVVLTEIDSTAEDSSDTKDVASKHMTAILPDEQEQVWTVSAQFYQSFTSMLIFSYTGDPTVHGD
jgi:hypothetical protein